MPEVPGDLSDYSEDVRDVGVTLILSITSKVLGR
jgi:hypothetical protein